MDNYFPNCPPKMSDGGRMFGDFHTATRRNEQIKYVNNIYRDDEYRLMLQENGTNILRGYHAYHKKDQCRPTVCIHQYPTRVSPQQMVEQMAKYNAVKSGQMPVGVECINYKDYKSSEY